MYSTIQLTLEHIYVNFWGKGYVILEKNNLQTAQDWTKSYIELTHPKKTGNHLRSHLRAIMALDHPRLIRPGKKIRPHFLRSTSLFCKIFPTNLGECKPTFHTIYTSHLRWNSSMRHYFYHTDLGQYFTILITYTKKLLNSDWLRKECSSSVTRVQITNGFWLTENIKETTQNQSD